MENTTKTAASVHGNTVTTNKMLETLIAQQAEEVAKLSGLNKAFIKARVDFDAAKADYNAQKEICERNARALKAYEPRKPRTKKKDDAKQQDKQ